MNKEQAFDFLQDAQRTAQGREDRVFVRKIAAAIKQRWSGRADKQRVLEITKSRTVDAPVASSLKVAELKPEHFESSGKRLRQRKAEAAADKPAQAKPAPSALPQEEDPDAIPLNAFAHFAEMSDKELIKEFGELAAVKKWARDVVGLKVNMTAPAKRFFPWLREQLTPVEANPFEEEE